MSASSTGAPRCATALSDVEVEHEDEHGHLWHIKYPVKGEDSPLRCSSYNTSRNHVW